jgi:phage terminase large subunit GpA-like protein
MSDLSDGYHLMHDAMARGLQPDSNLPVDQWADANMIVPKESGASEPGPYRTSRTPHARLPMQTLSANHPCKRTVVMGASQMLKTQVGLNFLGEAVHQRPKNFLWITPTGNLHKRAAARIDKTIAAVDVLRERFVKSTSRAASNNSGIKSFRGGSLYIVTAGAAANLAELSAAYVVYDEMDRNKNNINGEGDPKELGENRQTTHERDRKSYYPSSPTIQGESAIQDLYDSGTRRVALAECIHCGAAQPLDFHKLIRSEDGKRASYPCQIDGCGGMHEEGDKSRMFANGLWSEGVPGDGETESFHISAMFLPFGWLPWVSLMNQYDKAKSKLEDGSEESMIVFYNTRLALCWARTKETTKYDALMNRAEPYKLGTVPAGGLVLTAAIDTQAYRLELKVVAWGEGMECWIVDYHVIHGSPSEQETWDKADALLKGRYRHVSGAMMNISAAFVDSGGSNTQDVYNFVAPRKRRNVFAVKGHSRPNRPILSSKPTMVDITYRGKSEKRGAQLWFVGPDTAKDYLQARWAKTTGPGAVHFSADLPESYFKGLVAEYRTYGYKRGRKVSWWEQKKGEANEPLDLTVYNLGAAYFLGLHKKTEHGWQLLRDRLTPVSQDLFAEVPPTPEVQQAVQTRALPATSERLEHVPARREPDPPPAAPSEPARVVDGKITLGAGSRRGFK